MDLVPTSTDMTQDRSISANWQLNSMSSCNLKRNEQDLRKLTYLICQGAIFGYKVFTQPFEWTFEWSSSRSNQVPELVLFPALLKTTDDHGHFLPVPELKVPVTFAGSD
jgi:hypothetical protein